MGVLIGIDVGTSSVKAVMADADGTRLDGFAGAHGTARPAQGYAEQDPQAWLALVTEALNRFALHPRAREVTSIGVTSQVNTHLFCDATLTPLSPAITWQDTRAGILAAQLDAMLTHDDKITALGAPIPIDASHALSRMAWMGAHHPHIWGQTRHVLLPKDWIIAQLTGQIVADPLSAVGLAGPDFAYAPRVLSLVEQAGAVLPPLRDPVQNAGEVSAGPFRGVPVATGTMDAWAAMLGLGVAGEGQAMYLSGTSEVLGLIAVARHDAAGVIVFPDWRGITLHAAPTQSGGASLDWVGRLLGADMAHLDALAAKAVVIPQSPLFLPHLEGERAPIWDPSSRGAFAGLSGATGPAEMVASVMEGVAFSARLALEAVERSAGQDVPRLRHGGGGARSDIWCQIRANALGRPLERVSAPEAGAMGALVMGGVAAGLVPDLATAAAALVAVDRVFEPEAQQAARAQDRFALYQELYRATAPLSHRLSRS